MQQRRTWEDHLRGALNVLAVASDGIAWSVDIELTIIPTWRSKGHESQASLYEYQIQRLRTCTTPTAWVDDLNISNGAQWNAL